VQYEDVPVAPGRRFRMMSLNSSTKILRGERTARERHRYGIFSISRGNKKSITSKIFLVFRSKGSWRRAPEMSLPMSSMNDVYSVSFMQRENFHRGP